MQVTLAMRAGPMAGKERVFDPEATLAGRVVLGRAPGYDGLILEGDATVSRRHGEIFVQGRDLIFANLGGHGTVIDPVHCLGQRVLQPGAVLQVGSHEVEVRFESASPSRQAQERRSEGWWNRGPLARPAVRGLLAVYLLGLLALVAVMRGHDSDSAYRQARTVYVAEFLPDRSLTAAESTKRLESADRLADELMAHTLAQRWLLAEHVCYRLMSLDRDPESPLFRFAAQRLSTLARR